MKFTKMQGAGNDFIVLDGTDGSLDCVDLNALAEKLCRRRLDIGADGLMAAFPPREGGTVRLGFYNADGTAGEMCGNGARCLAQWCRDNLAGIRDRVRIETVAGPVDALREADGSWTVRLSEPADVDLARDAGGIRCAYLTLGKGGVPHAVLEITGEESEDELAKTAAFLCHHPAFPKGANINLFRLTGKNTVVLRTWERGVEGYTLACGTGSASTAAVLAMTGRGSDRFTVENPGGTLYVKTVCRDGIVEELYLTGPAVTVCKGEFAL